MIAKFTAMLKNKDIRKRILYTLLVLFIFRFGSAITVPGVNVSDLVQGIGDNTLFAMISLLGGGGLEQFSIFALGVTPYITASIIIQLLSMDVIPPLTELAKSGAKGRKQLDRYTRYLAVVLGFVQAAFLVWGFSNQYSTLIEGGATMSKILYIATIFTAGSMFLLWLGDRISMKGIGNGVSIIIMIGIIARLPFSFFAELTSRVSQQGGGLVAFLLELVFLFLVFCGSILLVQGTRKVPVQYAKRIVGNKQYGGVRQYIPLKINAAGVMPIIFAQAIMLLPISFINYAAGGAMTGFAAAFSDFTGFWYNATFFVLIVAFTYFYTAITVNPMQMSEDMKKNGGFIPGVKPGRKTMEFLDTIMSRITLPGSIFLGIVAIMPAFATMAGVNQQFAQFYGGTSLLILVGVVLDTLQQIESHLLMRHYDGLMKTGRIKGKTPGGPAAY